MNRPTQFTLPVSLPDSASLLNFIPPDGLDSALIGQLQDFNVPVLFVYGPRKCGLSHLLMASARDAESQDQYLPLADMLDSDPAMLQTLPLGGLISVDDVQALEHTDQCWCEALFHLYHRQLDAGGVLRFGSHAEPRKLSLPLPDLMSRMLSGPVWAIPAPDEDQVKRVLEARSNARGFEMSEAVLTWLLNRESRDLGHLMRLLDRLDRMTLQQRRRLTVPFLAQWLNQVEGEGSDR